MRMPLSGRPPKNTLQMRVSRFLRDNHSLIAWHDTIPRDKPNAARDRVLRSLTDAQKRANTTRGSTPGLIDPSLGIAGGVVPFPVLRRGQVQSRKLRKDWAHADASTQAGQPQYHRPREGRARCSTSGEQGLKEVKGKKEHLLDGYNALNVTSDLDHEREAGDKAAKFTAPVDKPARSYRSANKDALYSSQARQGTVESRHHVTSPMKRKRENVDELQNCICNEEGRLRKRTRQDSQRAGEEAKAASKRYGIPLDPALFTDTSTAPAPSHYGSALSESDAGRIFFPTGGYQVSDKFLTGRFRNAKQPQSAALGTPESSRPAGGAMTRGLLTAPVTAMVTSRADAPSLLDDNTSQNDVYDEQAKILDWDDWLDLNMLENNEVTPSG